MQKEKLFYTTKKMTKNLHFAKKYRIYNNIG